MKRLFILAVTLPLVWSAVGIDGSALAQYYQNNPAYPQVPPYPTQTAPYGGYQQPYPGQTYQGQTYQTQPYPGQPYAGRQYAPPPGYRAPGTNAPVQQQAMPPGGYQRAPYIPPPANTYPPANQPAYPTQPSQPAYNVPPAPSSNPPASAQQAPAYREIQTPDDTAYDSNAYSNYYDQSVTYFNQGNLTKAIELLEKALPIAPENSVSITHNNLAVYYMKRGNYYLNNKQYPAALNDYLSASFLMEAGWPDGADKTENQKTNTGIATDNLNTAFRALKINPSDKTALLDLAKSLRLQGKFQPAIAAYDRVLKADPKNVEAAKSLGDLFVVLNRPAKAKSYFKIAAQQLGPNANDELLAKLGHAQNKSGEVNEAIKSLDQALAINPANKSALNQLEEIWSNEIKYNPTSVPAHANLAAILQKKKMYKEALSHYQTAEQFANAAQNRGQVPPDVVKQIRLNYGSLYQEMGNIQMATRAYDSVLEIDPRNVAALYYKATLLRDTGKMGEAIQAYHKVLAIDPNHTPSHTDLLALILKQPNPQQIANDLEGYALRFPNNATIQTRAAEHFHQIKQLDKAIHFYQQALRINPGLAGVHANLGSALNEKGDSQQALAAFQKAVELEPDNETFRELQASLKGNLEYQDYAKAVELQQAGKIKDALIHFEKAVAAKPNDADMRLAYAVALQSDQQLDKAINEYLQVLKTKPNDAAIHYSLGTAYHQLQKLDAAKKSYEQALRLDPNMKDAKDAIAMIGQSEAATLLTQAVDNYNGQKYPQALQLVQRAIALNGQDPTAHYYKGLILTAQNKNKDAIISYRDAIHYNPAFRDAYYALGVALDTEKDVPGAKAAFQKFVELSGAESTPPDESLLQYARERLSQL